MENNDFKSRLREAMTDRNMKAVDLANKAKIPKGAISYYLAGKSQPKSDRLYEIAKVLDVNEAWLLGYDVPKERTKKQKENDDLVKITVKLRKDQDFFNTVKALSELSEEQYNSIKQLLSAFTNQ